MHLHENLLPIHSCEYNNIELELSIYPHLFTIHAAPQKSFSITNRIHRVNRTHIALQKHILIADFNVLNPCKNMFIPNNYRNPHPFDAADTPRTISTKIKKTMRNTRQKWTEKTKKIKNKKNRPTRAQVFRTFKNFTTKKLKNQTFYRSDRFATSKCSLSTSLVRSTNDFLPDQHHRLDGLIH